MRCSFQCYLTAFFLFSGPVYGHFTNLTEYGKRDMMAGSVSISSSASSNTICAGTTVTFTATPSGIASPYYQWKKNGVEISGATNSTLVISNLVNNDAISVEVADGGPVSSGLVLNLDAGNPSSYSGSGTTWTDLSGNGNNGTLIGGVSYSSSGGGSIVFSGTANNDYVSVANSSSLNLTSAGTLSIWINPGTLTQRVLTSLLGKTIDGAANGQSYYLDWTGGTINGFIQNAGTYKSISTPIPTALGWYNYVFSWGNGYLKLYKNGSQAATPVANTMNAQSITAPVNIGGYIFGGAGGNQNTFNGKIPIVQIFNRDLSDAEVLQNFNYQSTRFLTTAITSNTITTNVYPASTVSAASSSPTLFIDNALTDITHATTGATGIGTATGLPSGVTAGWANNTITISGTPTVSGTFNYSIPLTGGCGSVNATGTIIVSSLISWTGTGGNNLWSNASNWSTGTVPTTNSTIVISTGHPNLNQNFEVGGSLTLSNTGSLTISTGYTLSIASGGVADFGGKSVTFKSDATGSGQLGIVAGTLSNASNVTVERHIPSGKRAFRFLTSPVTTTTSIRQNWMEGSTAGVWSGYPYSNSSAYNLNPGYGTQITGSGGPSNGFDETLFNNPSLFSFNNNSGAWEAITSTTGTITAGTAYRILVRGDRSYNMALNYEPPGGATILRTNGTLAQGQLTTGIELPALSQSADGWSLVGNPYQSVVDLYSSHVVKTNLTDYYYIWDPRQATRGAYVAYNMTIASGGNNNLSSGMTRFLQPGQAFFVQNTAAGNGSIVFKEAAKGSASEQTATFGNGNTGVDYSALSAQLFYADSLAIGRGSMDGIRVLFGSRFSNAVNAGDGRKFTNPDETMSIKRSTDNLSMELRSIPDTATVIPLSISQYRVKRYTLRLVWDQPLAEDMVAILKDKYLGKETMINKSGYTDVEYVLDGQPASSASDRFEVVFKSTTINLAAIAGTPEVCVGASAQLFNATPGGTWSSNNPAIVSIDANGNIKANSIGNTELVYTVSRYDNTKSVSQLVAVNPIPAQPTITRNADGQLVSSSTTGNQWYKQNEQIVGANDVKYKPVNPSYYWVRVVQNGCVSELSNSYYYTTGPLLDAVSGSFVRIFPNPVQSDVKIEFMLKEKNTVRVEVYDMKGKRVLEYKNVLTGAKLSMTSLAAGVYRFRVLSASGIQLYSYTIIKE